MPYVIKIKSQVGYPGTEQDSGDFNDISYPTREEAEEALRKAENNKDLMRDIWEEAAQIQGLEAWLEVVEEE